MFITAGIWLGARDRMLPPQISQIIVGALAAATVIAAVLVVCERMVDRVERVVVIVAGLSAQLATDLGYVREAARVLRGEAAEIQTQLDRKSPADDDPTVRLNASALSRGRTYGLAPVDRIQAITDEVMKRVDGRFEDLKEHVTEYGNQRYFTGYADRAADEGGGSVHTLTPRNGHRSTS
jgi:hypothetical protein